jgi:hypothetical protein
MQRSDFGPQELQEPACTSTTHLFWMPGGAWRGRSAGGAAGKTAMARHRCTGLESHSHTWSPLGQAPPVVQLRQGHYHRGFVTAAEDTTWVSTISLDRLKSATWLGQRTGPGRLVSHDKGWGPLRSPCRWLCTSTRDRGLAAARSNLCA